MCGIAGIYSPRNILDARDSIVKMLAKLRHRGPDGSGIWDSEDHSVVLGHRRLSIIDLSPSGKQPMESNCGRFVIVFNGEIYNYLEIRDKLVSEGERFEGTSDTEVFLTAISKWGLKRAVTNSVGMFAFALWDKKKHCISLSRDRVGKKPLYYSLDGNSLYFASEIKALKSLKYIDSTLNYEAISHYLSLSFIPAPMTVYKYINEIPNGHILTWDKDLRKSEYPYWRWPSSRAREKICFQEAVETSEKLLADAVKIRLRADVPVGIFLSGGIDSGLITALAAIQSTKPVKTYSIGFDDAGSLDETPMALKVAKRYGTDHHEIRVSQNIEGLLYRVVDAYDEPFGDPSALPSYAVASAASKDLKVVLNGEGSDELFGGYRRHMAAKFAGYIHPFVDLFPETAWNVLRKNLPHPNGFRTPYSFLYRFLRGFEKDPVARYLPWTCDTFTDTDKKTIFKQSLIGRFSTLQKLKDLSSSAGLKNDSNALSYFMALDFLVGMADCLLVKIDIATMANSLEGRSPFLDHRIVEWAASLDRKLLLPGLKSKALLRELARKYLPEEIVNAPKRGFELPISKWMNGRIMELTKDLCLKRNGIILSLMERKTIESMLDIDGYDIVDREKKIKRLWLLMMLGLWEERN